MKETFKSSFHRDGSCCFSHLLGMLINSSLIFVCFLKKSFLTNSWAGPGFPLFDLGKNSGWIAGCLTMDIATLDVLQPSTAGTPTVRTSTV